MMDPQVIQLLAALANSRLRKRFADMIGEEGVPADPSADRLFLQAGIVRRMDNGHVTVDEDGLRTLLRTAQQLVRAQSQPALLDQIPKKANTRKRALAEIADFAFDGVSDLAEDELGERLAHKVSDTALFRRALVDEGFVQRDPSGSRYWPSHLSTDREL